MATFPLREGDLTEFVRAMKSCSLTEACSEDAERRWSLDAWTYLVFVGLNALTGTVPRPGCGRWSRTERQAAQSIRAAVEARCRKDINPSALSEAAWKKDMASRLVGYGGEELGICETLTLEQVLPALPPESHGGSVDALDWVGPRTKEFLLNPQKLLKDESEVELPRMPGKVHVKEGDRLRIAAELVKRNVCDWVPLEKVHHVKGQPVLNGLFGVKKPSVICDGRPVLRLIMNLVGSNATQFQLEGGCDGLPSITAWQSILLEDGEGLACYQSDMASAFYLFKLPPVWLPHLCFNLLAKGERINATDGQWYALGCRVIPMGWLNSVGIMQEISENLMKYNKISMVHQVSRGKPLPPWFSEVLRESSEGEQHWWHVYLDNFAAAEKVVPEDGRIAARMCHEAAEKTWEQAGVISSAKKRVAGEQRIVELGAEIDGHEQQLGLSTEKMLKMLQATLWMLMQLHLNGKQVQVMAGRWVFGLQFRRPCMSILDSVWKFIGGKQNRSVKIQNLGA